MNEVLERSVVRHYGIRIPALLALPIVCMVVLGGIPAGWRQGGNALAWFFVVPLFAISGLATTALLNQYLVFLTFKNKTVCLITGLATLVPVSGVAVWIFRLLFPDMY